MGLIVWISPLCSHGVGVKLCALQRVKRARVPRGHSLHLPECAVLMSHELRNLFYKVPQVCMKCTIVPLGTPAIITIMLPYVYV